jgi:hypothetical protein
VPFKAGDIDVVRDGLAWAVHHMASGSPGYGYEYVGDPAATPAASAAACAVVGAISTSAASKSRLSRSAQAHQTVASMGGDFAAFLLSDHPSKHASAAVILRRRLARVDDELRTNEAGPVAVNARRFERHEGKDGYTHELESRGATD